MKSRKILPLSERLDKMQKTEAEGYRPRNSASLLPAFSDLLSLLLLYDKALTEAEKEIETLNAKLKNDD